MKIERLRFRPKDVVECNCGGDWVKGTVVQLLYRDDGMPPGMVAPYQIELEDGDLIYAPADSNNCIRRAGDTSSAAPNAHGHSHGQMI